MREENGEQMFLTPPHRLPRSDLLPRAVLDAIPGLPSDSSLDGGDRRRVRPWWASLGGLVGRLRVHGNPAGRVELPWAAAILRSCGGHS
jgi:hypothetical protein